MNHTPTEAARLAALHELAILDTPPESAYDDIVKLASFICQAPVAYLSFMDDRRQWYKSRISIPFAETSREDALCAPVLQETELVHVSDMRKDSRFADNSFVKNEKGVRFYAGVPLITAEGYALGTLCVLDYKERTLSPEQRDALAALGRQIMAQLELRRSLAIQALTQQALVASHSQTAGILESIAAPFISLDAEHRPIYLNTHSHAFLGVHPALKQKSLWELVPPLRESLLFDAIHRVQHDGLAHTFEEFYRFNERWFEAHVSPAPLGGVSVSLHDITARKQAEQEVQRQALYDQLTGLPNRVLLNRHLEAALARSRENGSLCALLFLDLNQFKSVNDRFGHAAGDQLLTGVAQRLRQAIRREDTVARFGGDEFIVVAGGLSSAADAALIARTIIDSFGAPVPLEERELSVSTSIGISLYPTDTTTQEILIRQADQALYRAKAQEDSRYAFYAEGHE